MSREEVPPRGFKRKWLLFMLRTIAIFELHQATICKAIDMKMIFFLMEIELLFTTKVLHLVSFWQWEFLELRNAPFKTSGSHLARLCSKENFREPLGLPSILAKVPRPQSWSPKSKFRGFRTPRHSCWGAQASKLVVQVHLMMKKYFVRTLILLACWSPNLVILGFRYDKNLHIILWNPSKFFRHSDSKWETCAMLRNCLGFKEGKVNISTGLHNFHWSLGQT